MALTEPSESETLQLFKDLETNFPSSTLGEGKWQILAVMTLTTRTKAASKRLTFHLRYLPSLQEVIPVTLLSCTST